MDTGFPQSFVAVAEHGSFAKAAHRLGLTAAAIAARVQAPEDSLFGLPQLPARSVVLIALIYNDCGLSLCQRAETLNCCLKFVRPAITGVHPQAIVIRTALTEQMPGGEADPFCSRQLEQGACADGATIDPG
ncbi:helix-turn-helix domain-containing protein [Cupriavidus basilensis]|uniref:helix-turn-helix domain-containing protein n=1 Tax=Cupriavidus basilensis TaxID=68895 RepID=UPI0009DA8701|nr:LysR family transcriptional regulator [Cupriavidus basilensis]